MIIPRLNDAEALLALGEIIQLALRELAAAQHAAEVVAHFGDDLHRLPQPLARVVVARRRRAPGLHIFLIERVEGLEQEFIPEQGLGARGPLGGTVQRNFIRWHGPASEARWLLPHRHRPAARPRPPFRPAPGRRLPPRSHATARALAPRLRRSRSPEHGPLPRPAPSPALEPAGALRQRPARDPAAPPPCAGVLHACGVPRPAGVALPPPACRASGRARTCRPRSKIRGCSRIHN